MAREDKVRNSAHERVMNRYMKKAKSKPSTGKVILMFLGVIVAFVAMAAVFALFNAWLIMLLWGALGIEFGFFTIGYWQAYLIALALTLVSTWFKTPKVNSK